MRQVLAPSGSSLFLPDRPHSPYGCPCLVKGSFWKELHLRAASACCIPRTLRPPSPPLRRSAELIPSSLTAVWVQPFGKRDTINHSLLLGKHSLPDSRSPLSASLRLGLPGLSSAGSLVPDLRCGGSSRCAGPGASLPSPRRPVSGCMDPKTILLLAVGTLLFPLFTPDVHIELLPDVSVLSCGHL